MRTPKRFGGCHNGLAAYDAWAEHLLRDEDFATDDIALLRDRSTTHHGAVRSVAEGRWYASVFLAEAALASGLNSPELYAAAACFAAEHDLMWQIWGIVGGLHLKRASGARLQAAAEALHELKPEFMVLCHCSGNDAINFFKQNLNTEIVSGFAGFELKTKQGSTK